MGDERFRRLERVALEEGTDEAWAALALARHAAGLCPWCGREAGDHRLLEEGEWVTRTCCCAMTCGLGLDGGRFRGPDWTRCDGKASLHCLGCPAVECKTTAEESIAAATANGARGHMDLDG